MTELEQAAREAISILNNCYFTVAGGCERAEVINVIRQLEAAIAQQEKPEPVVWKLKNENLGCGLKPCITQQEYDSHIYETQSLYEYMQPPRREWVCKHCGEINDN